MDGTIPDADDFETQPPAVRTFSPASIPVPACGGPCPRILLLHSDSTERQRLATLCRWADNRVEVVEVDNGQTAIGIVLEQRFDVVVCDTALHGLPAFTLLRIIRGRYSHIELPVVFTSSTCRREAQIEGFRLGANDFVSGDWSDDEFVARLQTQLNVAQMHQKTVVLMDELRVLVDTDPLTGLKNRRAFLRDLKGEFSRATRMRQQCALLLLDVDHFKRVNDSFGHPAGDDVLRAIAGLLNDGAREYDSVGRLGGEEFGVLLPDVDVEGAQVVAERIRAMVSARPLGPPGVGHVTISIGIAMGPQDRRDNEDALLRRADEALYAAKRNGRNRVFIDDSSGFVRHSIPENVDSPSAIDTAV